MERKHELWTAECGHVYKDETGKAMRFKISKQNVKYIEDLHNAGEHNYTVDINLSVNLTIKEFIATYARGLEIPDRELEGSLRAIKYETMEEEVLNYTTIPDIIDWRAEGTVTFVKLGQKCSKAEKFYYNFSFFFP